MFSQDNRVILSPGTESGINSVEGSSKVPVLRVKDVSVAFGFDKNGNSRDGRSPLQVTDRVSFDIFPGEFFALVGESGCGKSVTAMSILRLLPWPSAKIVNGEILFDAMAQDSRDADDGKARDLVKLPLKDLQSVRGSEIACIFQEPMQALNPVVTIKKQLLEVFKFGAVSKSAQSKNAQSKQDPATSRNAQSQNAQNDPLDVIREQLRLAGFTDPDRVLNSYPHELSGGMLQRVLITHNMGIVSQYAHRVAVMYAGRIVEEGPVREVINHPMHPYTQGLLAAIPESHSDLRTLASIPGSVPHPKDFAEGCRFADRCCKCAQSSADVRKKCLSAELPTKIAEADHFAYCFCAK